MWKRRGLEREKSFYSCLVMSLGLIMGKQNVICMVSAIPDSEAS